MACYRSGKPDRTALRQAAIWMVKTEGEAPDLTGLRQAAMGCSRLKVKQA